MLSVYYVYFTFWVVKCKIQMATAAMQENKQPIFSSVENMGAKSKQAISIRNQHGGEHAQTATILCCHVGKNPTHERGKRICDHRRTIKYCLTVGVGPSPSKDTHEIGSMCYISGIYRWGKHLQKSCRYRSTLQGLGSLKTY